MYDDANHLCKALKKRRSRFLGGEEPNLGDLAAFGALSSFEGTEAFKVPPRGTYVQRKFFK